MQAGWSKVLIVFHCKKHGHIHLNKLKSDSFRQIIVLDNLYKITTVLLLSFRYGFHFFSLEKQTLGTQKTISLDFDEEKAHEGRQGIFRIS